MTLAAGIETGKIIGNETYNCGGYLDVADQHIRCNVRTGHGTLDVSGALEQSCNVAFMKMGEAIGKTTLLQFLSTFNIGLKTNIDLAGEARTASLVFTDSTMGTAELATSSFGQGYNVTMIEMITAFSSIVNGGYYYEPHVVSKIVNSNGDTIKNIDTRVLKQTISETTSEQMREYLYNAVAVGTGKTARPAGYEIGGKTGTAQTLPRGNGQYVVSFIGFAPADNPQIAIYCVVDRPNVADQAHATYATGIVKNILTEVLPYMHISKTVEMTVAEQEQVDEILGNIVQSDTQEDEAEGGDDENADENGDGDNGDNGDDENNTPFYVVDPTTGELKDAVTGEPADMDYAAEGDETTDNGTNSNTVQ
jgi:stage V sporulation protein D (sporulation-specific penicillin-binding protein)